MSDAAPRPVASEDVPAESAISPARPKRRWWQLRLGTLILLIAALAVWLSWYADHRRNEALEQRLRVMRPIARELIVQDPTQAAIVKREETWHDENLWDVYLPAGSYEVCLATREIGDRGLPAVAHRRRIRVEPPARPRVFELRMTWEDQRTRRRIEILENGATLLSVVEPREWNSDSTSTQHGFSKSSTCDPARPMELFRRRFLRDDGTGQLRAPTVPSEGLLFWFEPASS